MPQPLGVFRECARPQALQPCRFPRFLAHMPSLPGIRGRGQPRPEGRGTFGRHSLGLLPLATFVLGVPPLHRECCPRGHFLVDPQVAPECLTVTLRLQEHRVPALPAVQLPSPDLPCPVLSCPGSRKDWKVALGDFPHPWRDAQETIRQPVAQGLKGAKFSVACVGRGPGQRKASGVSQRALGADSPVGHASRLAAA